MENCETHYSPSSHPDVVRESLRIAVIDALEALREVERAAVLASDWEMEKDARCLCEMLRVRHKRLADPR